MRWTRKLGLRVRSIFKRSQVEQDLDDELRDYYEREAATAPVTPGIERLKEECRDARGTGWIEDAVKDLHFAFRSMRRAPGFTLTVVATLALGIGANTAIFSVVNGILIKPLGYAAEDRLVTIHEVQPRISHVVPRLPVNALHFTEWRQSVQAFEQMAMIGEIALNLTGAGEPERLVAARVSPSLFPMLGARMQVGRAFLEEEDQPGRDDVVILTHSLWQRRFSSDPNIVGRKIALDGHPYEVTGVLSSDFHFPKLSQLYAMTVIAGQPEVWKPFAVKPSELDDMGDFNYACIARLRQGVSLKRALAELDAAQARLASRVPEKVEFQAALVPLQDQITGRSRNGLQLLLWAAAAVLLIGCANIANLMLARVTSRKRELAIRSAMGAGVRRLSRQILAESLLLAGIGGALGLLIAYASLRLLLSRAPIDLPRLDEVHLDPPVLLFTIIVSGAAGLLCCLLPTWRLARTDPREAMQSSSRGSTEDRSARRLRSLLVAVEVGLSALCLISSGLLLRSFLNLLAVDKGFTVQHVVTVNLSLPATRYPDQPARTRFTRSLLESVSKLPGVVAAGVSNMLPLSGEGGNNSVSIEGTKQPFMERPTVDVRNVNPEYFSTLGIPVRQGKIFAESDGERALALVSALTAERLWPRQNPLGKRFRVGDPNSPFLEVTGVVGDVKSVGLDKTPAMTVYLPYWRQRWRAGQSLVIRTTANPMVVSTSVRNAIRQADSELPIPAFQTMEQIVDESVAQRRFQMTLVLLFASAALVLASLGIYGVVSYSVALRRNEMGIRMALGARGADIVRMILHQGMTPVALGLCAGIVVSLAAARLLAGLLYGVAASDPITIAGVTFVLGSVAAFASFLPARRATRVDPSLALRDD
jgi:predicted permease